MGLGIFISNSKNQILLMKRRGSHGAGTWCPPGGHLELRESFLECARKEAKEEVDLNIRQITVLGITNGISFKEDKHYITIHTKATEWEGKPKIMEPNKCSEIGWFSLKELPSPLFLPIANAFKEGSVKI